MELYEIKQRENREKKERKLKKTSWGTSDNGATTAPWQLYKVCKRSCDSGLLAWWGCRTCGTVTRKSSRSPGPFLVVSHYTVLDDARS